MGFQPLVAQDKLLPVFHFQRLSTATGLSSNLIGSQVIRDRNGIIWVGTMAGLDRYDGYGVKQYRNVPGDPHSLPSNIVYALALDRRERLWVGTYGTGLSVYDPSRDGFVHLLPRSGDSSSYGTKGIYAIREDRAGNLWLGTETGGVVCVELPGGQGTENLDSLARKIRMTTYHLGTFRNIAHDLCIWSDGRIFAGSDSGIVVINPESHATSRLIPHNPSATLVDSVFVSSVTPDGMGNLWVGTMAQGAFLVDPVTNKTLNYRHKDGDELSIKSNGVHHILQDPRGNLWFSTAQGLDLFDPVTGRTAPYLSFGPGPQRSNCWWLATDNTGTLWISTEIDGLYLLSQKSLRYPLFSLPDSKGRPRSFEGSERDVHGALLVSSQGEAMQFDFATLRIQKRFRAYLEEQTTNADHDASASYIDTHGVFWYGSNEHGLYSIDLTSGLVRHFTYPSRAGAASSVRSIAPAPGNRLWIGSRQEPVMRFDCVSGQFRFVPEVTSPYALHVMSDREGCLWVSAEINGIIQFNPTSGSIAQFVHDPNDPHSLGNGLVYKSYQDPLGRIWVGAGVLINLWEPLTRTFARFPNPAVNPAFTVYPLGTDARGRVLTGSDEYLSILDPSNGRYENFDGSDGFCGGPVDMDTLSDGRILVTGWGGMNIFSADSLTQHRAPPPLVITGLTINDEFVLPPSMQNGGWVSESCLHTERARIPVCCNGYHRAIPCAVSLPA